MELLATIQNYVQWFEEGGTALGNSQLAAAHIRAVWMKDLILSSLACIDKWIYMEYNVSINLVVVQTTLVSAMFF